MPKDNEAMNSGGNENAFHFAGLSQMANTMPGMEAVMQVHRRNAEVFTQATQQIFQGYQEIMQRQAEMFRESFQQSQQMMGLMMQPGAPQEKLAGQAETAKAAMEKVASNSKEIFDMAASCQMKAAELVTSRMGEAFEEFRSACTRK
jgi:phasin family protein